MKDATGARGGRGWQGLTASIFLLVGLVAVVYLAMVVLVGRTTPQHLTVGGVDLSAKPPAEAQRLLQREADRLMDQPVTLVVDGQEREVQPEQLGLGYDVAESLEGTSGRTWDPRDLWVRAAGDVERDWVVTVDQERLHDHLRDLSREVGQAPVKATISLEGTEVTVKDGQPGTAVDVEESADRIEEAWPATRRAEVGLVEMEPEVSADDLRDFASEVLEPALAQDITLIARPVDPQGGGEPSSPASATGSSDAASGEPEQLTTRKVVISREDVASMVSIGGTEKEPAVEVNATRWRDQLPDGHPLADGAVREPSLTLTDDGARVTAAQVGRSVSTGDIETAVREAVRSAERTSTVDVAVVRPRQDDTGWKAQRLGTFSTTLPGGEENEGRTHNIKTLSKKINGTVVPAGEQFSLLEVMGEPTKDAGYKEAHVISNGTLSNAVGGGLSQVSTAVYNVAFVSGVQLDEHKPHSYYIARYPEGREATLWYPAIDNVWTNDSPSPMIVRSELKGQELVMTLYGTPQYTVESTTKPRENEVEHRRYHSDAEDCVDQIGVDGFDVTVERVLTPVKGFDGKKRTETIETHYDPSDEVFCTNPKSKEYSGSQQPPSAEYRPFSQREQDVKDDAKKEAEEKALEDQLADQEAGEKDGPADGE